MCTTLAVGGNGDDIGIKLGLEELEERVVGFSAKQYEGQPRECDDWC
jgi:hypothetical protein